MFISILYLFRATMFPSSGEITVSVQHLVFVTVWMTVWYAGCIPDGHPHRVTNTRSGVHPAYQTVIHTEWQIPGVALIQLFLLMMGT